MADVTLGKAKGEVQITYDGKGIARARDELGRFVGGGGAGGGSGSLQSAQVGFQKLATVSAVAATAIVGGIALAVNAAIDFEKRISAIGAVSGASADQLDQLRKKALQLGKDTAFSASESAQAMEELVKAGLTVADVLNGAADATVALAAAGGIELPAAATIAANSMNIFGIAAKDMMHVVDLIAGAANASAIDVNDFGMAMQQAGAVAHLVGVSFDDLAVAIALMGNAGIKGSDAGTSLKTMLSNLQPSTKKQSDLMRRLGIITQDGTNRFFDQTGSLKSLADVAGILNKSLSGMTDAQKAMALEVIFGSDAIRAAAVLSGQGAEGFNKMAEAMGKVTAEGVAAARLDNVAGAIEQLKGSVETAAIAFGSALLPVIRKVAEFITFLANKFSELDPRWQQLIAFAAVAVAALIGFVAIVATVAAAVAAMVASVAAIKFAIIIGAIVGAVIAIAAAIKLAYDRSQEFRDFLGKLGEVGKAIFGAILAVVRPIVAFFKGSVIPAVREVAASLQKNLQPAFKAISEFITSRVLPAVKQIKDALDKAMPTIIQVAEVLLKGGKAIVEGFGAALGFIIPIILKLAGPIFSLLINAISFLISHIPQIVSAINTFIGVLVSIGKIIATVVIAPFYAIYLAGKFVFEQLSKLVSMFVTGFMLVWNMMWPVTKAVFDLIMAIVGAAFSVISGMFQLFWSVVTAIWNALWTAVIGPVINGFKVIMAGIGAALEWIMGKITGFWNAVQTIWNNIFNWIVPPITKAWNAVKDFVTNAMLAVHAKVVEVWNAVVAFFMSAKDRIVAVINGFSAFVTKVRDFFGQMKDAAISKATELINWVTGLPGRIMGALGNLGSALYGAGRSLLEGLWNGLKSIWGSIIGWVQDKMASLRGLLPFSPAKWGPFSGHGYTLYAGRALMEGFAQGMAQRIGIVESTARDALSRVADALPTDFSTTVGTTAANTGTIAGVSGGAALGQSTTTVNNKTEIAVNVPLKDLTSIKDVQEFLDFVDRLRNDSRRGFEVAVL